MGRIYSDRQLGLGVQPTPENTAARKDERVCAVVTDDGQFQIAVERCGVYWLPFHSSIIGSAKPSALIQISPYGRISDVPAVKREAEEDWGLRLKRLRNGSKLKKRSSILAKPGRRGSRDCRANDGPPHQGNNACHRQRLRQTRRAGGAPRSENVVRLSHFLDGRCWRGNRARANVSTGSTLKPNLAQLSVVLAHARIASFVRPLETFLRQFLIVSGRRHRSRPRLGPPQQ